MKLNVGYTFKMEQKTTQIQEGPINKDMTMGDILQNYPAASEVMLSYGLHCIGCHVSTWETLEQGILGHGGGQEQVEALVSDINTLIKEQKFSDNEEIALTEKASLKLKEILTKYPDKTGLRIQVIPGGCSGLSYDFTLVESSKEDEKILEQFGVKIFIDQESLNQMKGSKIDYVDALQGAGFKVHNPKATSTCGCGQSFS